MCERKAAHLPGKKLPESLTHSHSDHLDALSAHSKALLVEISAALRSVFSLFPAFLAPPAAPDSTPRAPSLCSGRGAEAEWRYKRGLLSALHVQRAPQRRLFPSPPRLLLSLGCAPVLSAAPGGPLSRGLFAAVRARWRLSYSAMLWLRGGKRRIPGTKPRPPGSARWRGAIWWSKPIAGKNLDNHHSATWWWKLKAGQYNRINKRQQLITTHRLRPKPQHKAY
ncbi:uncharacterized protein LOC119265368 [Pygocentrus nattereri]|uniref:uncharacterized protein LOC119265368 n=1 Tax=Pygocentrus nattereri TaxID=42514 RepID=UPI001890BA48|nr:uncharacterized protein LOC119265368 [Pygocentrus nattereri]